MRMLSVEGVFVCVSLCVRIGLCGSVHAYFKMNDENWIVNTALSGK